MSIQIIGSNGNFIKYIVENKLENIFNDKITNYELLKKKYYNKIVNKEIKITRDKLNLYKKHYIIEIIKLFNNYNKDLSLELNINNFIKFIHQILDNSNNFNIGELYLLVNRENDELFEKLNNAILKLVNIIKGNNKNFKIVGNQPFITLKKILQNIEYKKINNELNLNSNKNTNLNLIIDNILSEINNYNKIINKINNMYKIKLNKSNLDDYNQTILNNNFNSHKNNLFSDDFIINLTLELDNIIIIYKLLKSNIILLDNNINNIIELIYKLIKILI